MSEAEETPAYRLEISDSAEAEADAVYLWMSRNLGPAYADRWYRELWAKVGNLVSFPRRGQRVPGQDETVRRLLYGRYRVLYRIVAGEEDEEAVIRVLRIVHAGGQGAGQEEASGEQ